MGGVGFVREEGRWSIVDGPWEEEDLGFVVAWGAEESKQVKLTFCHPERSEGSYLTDKSPLYLSSVHVPRRRSFAPAQDDKENLPSTFGIITNNR
jgi:hypothetical protein